MINIKKYLISILFTLITFSCIDPRSNDLWSISILAVLNTEGFARDAKIAKNHAFVAAGQSGIQIWDLDSKNRISNFTGYEEGGTFLEFDDLGLIGIDTLNNLIFSTETNKDVKIFHYPNFDSIEYRNTIMSARTKEFISFSKIYGEFFMFAADNDDGIKWHRYNLDTTSAFGINFIEWTPFGGGEIYTPGKPEGIDSDGDAHIALAVDQMGVELYSMDSLGSNPTLIGIIGTEGNAEKVRLVSDGVFASCDDAGAYFIPLDSFNSNENKSIRFAMDFTVDHISVNKQESIVAVSLGTRGIALYDISDKENPIDRGVFSIGYVYKTMFWKNNLVVCSREGIQLIEIDN